MKFRLEIIGLFFGLLGTAIFYTVLTMWSGLPMGLRELFRGGEVGAVIFSVTVIFGIISFILMMINLAKGQTNYWLLRFIGFTVFFLLFAGISSRV